MNDKLEYIIIGILFSSLAYFLKDVIDDVKELKKQVNTNKTDLDVLKTDYVIKYENLTARFEEFKDAMHDLTQELKEFRKDISEELKKK